MIANPDDKKVNEFKDVNSTSYYYVIEPVQPYHDLSNATHYVIICVLASDQDKPR